jgi:hypothetical protein
MYIILFQINSQASESGMDSSVDSEGSRKRRLNPNDAAIEKTLEMVESLIRNKRDVDEYTLFGEQIAFKLRTLKTDYARITVQHHINNLIYEAQLGKYDHPQTQNQGYYTTQYSTNAQSSNQSNLPSTSQYARDLTGYSFSLDNINLPSTSENNITVESLDNLEDVSSELQEN